MTVEGYIFSFVKTNPLPYIDRLLLSMPLDSSRADAVRSLRLLGVTAEIATINGEPFVEDRRCGQTACVMNGKDGCRGQVFPCPVYDKPQPETKEPKGARS